MQSGIDIQLAYDDLYSRTPTVTGHAPAFGGGETLVEGVYAIAAAGSVAGDLTLDGGGNADAIFIFKFGGAFTTGASTTIHLINGASSCNILWGAEGAIAMAASTSMKGRLIANNGAISMGAGGILEGRMFSTTGAASVYNVAISSFPCALLPVQLISFSGNCIDQYPVLTWRTASEVNNHSFSIERSITGILWELVGTVKGSGNTSSVQSYILTDQQPNKEATFYRLKQVDLNGNYKYGNILAVKDCILYTNPGFTLYPNPSNGKMSLLAISNPVGSFSVEVYNIQGQQTYKSNRFQTSFDFSDYGPGLYVMKIKQNKEVTSLQFLITQ